MAERKNSDARLRANAKYNAKTYRRYAINVRKEYVSAIDEYKEKNNITSDSGIFNAVMKYCIENDIDLKKFKF